MFTGDGPPQAAMRDSMQNSLGANLKAVDAFNDIRKMDNGDGANMKQLAMRWRAKTRACRLLNSKARTIGINVDDLFSMKRSKMQAKCEEKQEGIKTAQEWKMIKSMLTEQQIKDTRQKSELANELVNDWRFQKNQADRIEADLNPKLNRGQPVDPDTCGIGAAQNFAGEDRDAQERSRIQATQVKVWCDEQVALKREREAREKEGDREMSDVSKIIDEMRLEDQKQAIVQSRQAVYDLNEDNRLLAKQKRTEERMQALLEKQANEWEVKNARTNPLLCETTTTHDPSGRVRRDHWKGMSQQEVNDIHKFNRTLAEEQKETKRLEKEEDKFWVQTSTEINSELNAQEMEEEKRKASDLYELKTDHLLQARDHKQSEKFLKQNIGQGAIGEGFYSQFGY